MKKTTLIIALIFAFTIQSCSENQKIIAEMMSATQASPKEFTNGVKKMKFVPMVHMSTKDFYKDVARIIEESKKEGYVLFYEWIDFDKANETELRKLRKLVGMIPSPEGYKADLAKMNKPNMMVQDNDMFLNLVNNKDYNIDITPTELLAEFEKEYGEIELTDIDLNTPLDQKITTGILPGYQVNNIILLFRSAYVAQVIQKSEFDKILVLYGASHLESLVNDLKTADPNWKALEK